MSAGPLLRCLDCCGLIILPALGNVICEGIIWVGGAKESLDGEQDCADLEGRRPVVWIKVRKWMDR